MSADVNSNSTTNTATFTVASSSSRSFTHDENGNLTSDGRWDCVWDAANRLVQQTASESSVAAGAKNLRIVNAYDYAGRRIKKTVSEWNGSGWAPKYSLNFLYDGWNLAAEAAANGGPTLRSYAWGADLSGGDNAGGIGGLTFIRYPIEGKTLAVASDGQGNTSALYDMEDAGFKATYEYGPFGEPLRVSGPFAEVNSFRFSTKYETPETGWLEYTFRPYNPATGRWASQDPIGEEGGINLYGFVGNNPVNLIDLLGLIEWWNVWVPGQYSWEMAITSFRAGDPVMGVSHMSAYVGEVAFTLATFGAGLGAYQATRETAVVCSTTAAKGLTGAVDDLAIQFGKNANQIQHAFRHTDALGLDRVVVRSGIQNHFKTVASQIIPGKPFNQVIEVGGQRIQYTAFKLQDGTINVGRIYGAP